MDRAAEMTAFVRAVETGGFTAAARGLGLTPSALSKLVTRLEDRLGARLLQRTTRRLQLTAEGEAFFARARPILTAMDEAEAEVSQAGASPRGLLRLSCGSTFGLHQLARAIPRFLEMHPDVEIDLTISDQPSGVLEEGIDLARRIRELDPDVRIIIISGYFYGNDVKIKTILSEGLISGFISKPFLHHEVLKIINSNLKARSRDPK